MERIFIPFLLLLTRRAMHHSRSKAGQEVKEARLRFPFEENTDRRGNTYIFDFRNEEEFTSQAGSGINDLTLFVMIRAYTRQQSDD